MNMRTSQMSSPQAANAPGRTWRGHAQNSGNWNGGRVTGNNWNGSKRTQQRLGSRPIPPWARLCIWLRRRRRLCGSYYDDYAYNGYPYDNTYYNDPYYSDTFAYDTEPTVGVTVTPGADDPAYCVQRFRSYDPASGTYLGYDGMRHPCP